MRVPIKVRASEVAASLDTNRSGHVTEADLPPEGKLRLRAETPAGSSVTLEFDETNIGLAARIHEYTKKHAKSAVDVVVIPSEILHETPTARALLASDSYDS